MEPFPGTVPIFAAKARENATVPLDRKRTGTLFGVKRAKKRASPRPVNGYKSISLGIHHWA